MKESRKVSIRGGFSDRNKIKPLNTVIQYESLDDHSRNSIAILVVKIIQRTLDYVGYNSRHDLAEELLMRIFNEPVELHSYPDLDKVSNELRDVCLHGDYDEVLTMIETLSEIADKYEGAYDDDRKRFDTYGSLWDNEGNEITEFPSVYDYFNELFEEEFIGYKFVDRQICKITSQTEIDSILESLKTPYDNVNNHMKKAISLLKETGEHDYKNSIKESIVALECLLNIVLGTEGLTLGKAINEYAKRVDIHPALKESISSLYGFSSDSSGIRHDGNKKDYNEGFDEAKLILVNTSAFINYIISTKKD